MSKDVVIKKDSSLDDIIEVLRNADKTLEVKLSTNVLLTILEAIRKELR
jgi:hypothetical protein